MTESIDQGIVATGAQVGAMRLAEPDQFRVVLVSFLAAATGLIAGGDRLPAV